MKETSDVSVIINIDIPVSRPTRSPDKLWLLGEAAFDAVEMGSNELPSEIYHQKHLQA